MQETCSTLKIRKIKQAVGGQMQDAVLVEQDKKSPVAYESLEQAFLDLLFPEFKQNFKGQELTVNVSFVYNPPSGI